jgi:hypothetical protein
MRPKMLYLSESARKPGGDLELQARIAVRPGVQSVTLTGLRYETSVRRRGVNSHFGWSLARHSDAFSGFSQFS